MAKRRAQIGRPRLFVAYSIADSDAVSIVGMLGGEYLIVNDLATSTLPIALALQNAVRGADAAVVVLPSPGDPAWVNVIFEAGLAVGFGLPVVLIGDAALIPRSLVGLPVIQQTDASSVMAALAIVLGRHPERAASKSSAVEAVSAPALSRDRVALAFSTLPVSRSEADVEHWVAALLRDAGAEVAMTDTPGDLGTADLSVWHDGLQATFGLPLPVEVLARTRRLKPVLARLQRTMRASGATSLIAISAVDTPLCERWTDGKSLVLAVDARRLVESLAVMDLPGALAGLLATSDLSA